jgi:hypothetical protein
VILKIVPKAGFDMYTRENRLVIAKEAGKINYEAAFGTSFKIGECFQKLKQKLGNYFYLSQGMA